MNIEVIAEHSADIDLLPENAKVLDLGCRGFLFTDELRRRGNKVVSVDCDKFDRDDYLQIGLSDENGLCSCLYTNDPQATTIKKALIPLAGFDIQMMTIQALSAKLDVEFWDLIKLDIEGSEYEVIMSMDRPYATQLSIEFHLHTGIYGENEMLLMENKLLWLGYFPVQHDKTKQHGLSYNYWDSLFILK